MSRDAYHHFLREPVKGAPIVFSFHGTGGDEHQFTGLIDQILPEAGIIAPRGDVSEYGANRFFRRQAEGVYDMADLSARTDKMAEFIRAHRTANEGVPIYALGYSNGANILASVMLQSPKLFDRVVLMHPLIPWTPSPNTGLQSLNVLVTAGRHDPICPLPLTETFVDFLRDQQAGVEVTFHDGGHELRQEEVIATAAFLGGKA